MIKRNSFFIIFVSIICTSSASAMLCLVKKAQRSLRPTIRYASTGVDARSTVRTIEQIYKDVVRIGDRDCSRAFDSLYECSSGCFPSACVRFVKTSAKNMEMQQDAQKKRDNYWLALKIRLSNWRHFDQNVYDHVVKLGSEFHKLHVLEIETRSCMSSMNTIDDFLLYNKILTLTAHKKNCLLTQVDIIHENSITSTTLQKMKEQNLTTKSFSEIQVSKNLQLVGVNQQIILYKKFDDKE